MVKASWGTKRTCQSCGARFYDLNKGPIKCPKCGREHDREDFVKVRRGRGATAAAAAATAAAAAAAAKLAAKKKSDEAALAGDELPDVEGDEELAEADDLADDAERAEAHAERRTDEADAGDQEPVGDEGHRGATPRTAASDSAKRAFSSGVPTVTRRWRWNPYTSIGRTITPRRSSASYTWAASPTSISRKFAQLGT